MVEEEEVVVVEMMADSIDGVQDLLPHFVEEEVEVDLLLLLFVEEEVDLVLLRFVEEEAGRRQQQESFLALALLLHTELTVQDRLLAIEEGHCLALRRQDGFQDPDLIARGLDDIRKTFSGYIEIY